MAGSVCARCGAEIKHVFRVGPFHFGSECIGKIDADVMQRLYGERLELGEAIHVYVAKRMRSRAKGISRDVQIDVAAIPRVGERVRAKNASPESRPYEVVGYTPCGIRLKGYQVYNGIGREFFNDFPFDRAGDLNVVTA